MKPLAAAWALAQKDLRSFVRDRTALVLSILVPVALVTVFGWIMAFAFGGSGGMPKVSLHVADLDHTAASQRFAQRLKQQDMLRVRTVTTGDESADSSAESTTDANDLEQLIRDGDAHHVLIIPSGFGAQVDAGTTPQLRMLRDPGREMEDRVTQIAVMQAAMSELGGTVWVDAMDRLLADQGMDTQGLQQIREWMTNIGQTISDFAVAQQAAQEDSPEEPATTATTDNGNAAAPDNATEEPGDNDSSDQLAGPDPQAMLDMMSRLVPMETTDVAPPNRNQQITYQQAQSVAGMSVMMLLFALTSCGNVLLLEREEGTLRRLFAQPISRDAVLLGKFLFVLVVGVGQLAILFTYGEWMFRVGLFRDPMTLVVLSITWVCTGGAFGMFLASVSRSTKQAESLATLLILMMAALGGCWFPLQMMNLPPLLDTLCKSTPTFWAMTGFQGMLWNQLPWHTGKMLAALGWQWAWTIALTLAAVSEY